MHPAHAGMWLYSSLGFRSLCILCLAIVNCSETTFLGTLNTNRATEGGIFYGWILLLGWNRSWGLEYVLVEAQGTEPNPSHPYWRSLGFGFPRCCCRRRHRWRVWSRWCNPLQRAGTAPLRFYLSLWQTCCPACSTCTTPAAEGERTGGRMAELLLVMWAVPCPESCPLSSQLSPALRAAHLRCAEVLLLSVPAPDAQVTQGTLAFAGDTSTEMAGGWCWSSAPAGSPQRNLNLGQAKINP